MKFESEIFKLLIMGFSLLRGTEFFVGGSTASSACSMQGNKNVKGCVFRYFLCRHRGWKGVCLYECQKIF